MAEDIIVRLRAEADTRQMEAFVKGLQKVAEDAKKAGLTDVQTQRLVENQYNKVAAAAAKAGKSVQEYVKSLGQGGVGSWVAAQEGAKKAIEGIGKEAAKAHPHVSKLTREIGSMAARYVSFAAAVSTVKTAFGDFMEHDTDLRRLQNTLGLTEDQTKTLGTSIRTLSQNTKQSLGDATKAVAEFSDKMNVTGQEAVQALTPIGQAAYSTGEKFSDMAALVAQVMNNLKIPLDQTRATMDTLTGASNLFQFNLLELLKQSPKLTESMGSWGYSGVEGLTKVSAMLGALEAKLGSADKAAAALTGILEGMNDKDVAKKLNMSVGEMVQQLRASKDPIKEYIDMIAKAREQGLDWGELSKRLRPGLRILIEAREELAASEAKLAGMAGRTQTNFENMSKGIGGSFDELKIAIEGLSTSFGKLMSTASGGSGPFSAITAQVTAFEEKLLAVERIISSVMPAGLSKGTPAWLEWAKTVATALNPLMNMLDKLGRLIDYMDPKLKALKGVTADEAQRSPAPASTDSLAMPVPFYGGGMRSPSIAGRNWNHDLLPDSPQSENIEDRRNEATEDNTNATEQDITATERLTAVMERLAVVMETALGTRPSGDGAQYFSGGGGGGMAGGGARAGTGSGAGSGGLGGGGGGRGGSGGGGGSGGSGGGSGGSGGGSGGSGTVTGGTPGPGGLITPTAEGNVISVMGDSRDGGRRRHQGTDFNAPVGTPIRATNDQEVIQSGWIGEKYGWGVKTKDAEGRTHVYAHMDKDPGLKPGQKFSQGQTIGAVGNSGNARTTAPHVHYEMRPKGGGYHQAQNPLGAMGLSGRGRYADSGAPGAQGGGAGQPGTIDRSSLAPQLTDENVRLMAGLTKAETGSVSGEGSQQFLASHFNRTMIQKGATLHNRVFNGYYPQTTKNKLGNVSDAEVKQFREKTLGPVMQGAGGDHTNNASLDLANRQERKYGGTRDKNNELFYTKTEERARVARLPRNRAPDTETAHRNTFSERARRERRSDAEGGSPAGLPRQADSRRVGYNLDRVQFARRDRDIDKHAKTALLQASENAHADIGVA